MTGGQRSILVVAWGALLVIGAVTVIRLLMDAPSGWYAYAPDTGVVFDDTDQRTDTLQRAAIWVGAVLLWAGPSFWLARRRQDR